MSPSTDPVVVTAACLADLALVRALVESVAAHHPATTPVVLLVDGTATVEGARVVSPDGLDLDERTRHEIELCAAGADLAAALAPSLAATELARADRSGPPRPIVYLSPEVSVLGRLDELVELATGDRAVLVTRRLSPAPLDSREPSAGQLEALGVVDPGIVALGPDAHRFAASWSAALRTVVAEEHAAPRRTVRALDAAALHEDVVVYRGAAHGLAYWNADEWDERMRRSGAVELATVHDAGFDPSLPSLWTSEVGLPRVLLGDRPALAARLRARAERLRERSPRAAPLHLEDGTELDERTRRLFRAALRAHLERGRARPPDPLLAGGAQELYALLATPDPDDPAYASVPRVLADVHRRRDDLRWHFPRVTTVDAARFRTWVAQHGLEEERLSPGLVAELAATGWWQAPSGVLCAPPDALGHGVVLAGHLGAQAGVGEAARLVLEALAMTPIAHRAVGFDRAQRTAGAPARAAAVPEVGSADLDTNLIWVNADQLLGFAAIAGVEFFEGRYNIGGWVWETEELPAPMADAARLLDEIWVPSEFVRAAVEPRVDRPVHVVGHPIVAPRPGGRVDLRDFGLENDRPLVLVILDFLSCAARKNPLGAIDAFVRAFAPDEGPQLLVKTVNGAHALADLEELRIAAQTRPDVAVVDRALSGAARASLMVRADVVLSLHRAEGFGLVLGEAMALGRPVVATGYSGNLDFMDEDCAFLVPASRIRVGRDLGPYPAGAVWGEPDLEVAADLLRRALSDPDEVAARVARARRRVAGLGLAHSAAVLEQRLAATRTRRSTGWVPRAADAVRAAL